VTLDISPLLGQLALMGWELDTAMEQAGALAEPGGFVVAHDEGAGEDWITVQQPDTLAVAIVHTKRPFVIAEPSVTLPARTTTGPVVVLSIGLRDVELTADRDAVAAAFPDGRPDSGAIAEAFSAMDLWFATI
jgi:hypothetical protein